MACVQCFHHASPGDGVARIELVGGQRSKVKLIHHHAWSVALEVPRQHAEICHLELLADAAFKPDTLKVLFKALDDAWEVIAPTVSQRAEAIEAARLRLANIVLALARDGSNDSEHIKDAALQIWSADPDAG